MCLAKYKELKRTKRRTKRTPILRKGEPQPPIKQCIKSNINRLLGNDSIIHLLVLITTDIEYKTRITGSRRSQRTVENMFNYFMNNIFVRERTAYRP